MMRSLLLVSLGIVLVSAGCGSAPPRVLPQKETAVEWNRRAQAAYRAGDLRQALEMYQQALAASRAIEDSDGISGELMNIATVHYRLGETDKAHAMLDQILLSPAIPFSGEQRAEAAYRKASFLLERDQLATASDWLGKVRTLCGSGNCGAEGKALNLRARMALDRKAPAEALAHAQAALAVNGKHEDRAEQANSLRLSGDAQLALAELAKAREAYLQALELDKGLGAGHKIALDLIGVGSSLLMERRSRDAAEYFRRARSVAEGVADPDLLATVDRLLVQAGR